MVLRLNLQGCRFDIWLGLEDGSPLMTHGTTFSVNAFSAPVLDGYVASLPGQKFSVNFEIDPLDARIWIVIIVDGTLSYFEVHASRNATRRKVSFVSSNEFHDRVDFKFSSTWPHVDDMLGRVRLFVLPHNFRRPGAPLLGYDNTIIPHLEGEAFAIFRIRYCPRATLEAWGYVPATVPIPLPQPIEDYLLG